MGFLKGGQRGKYVFELRVFVLGKLWLNQVICLDCLYTDCFEITVTIFSDGVC